MYVIYFFLVRISDEKNTVIILCRNQQGQAKNDVNDDEAYFSSISIVHNDVGLFIRYFHTSHVVNRTATCYFDYWR
jgi:hypothetical protein